MTATYDCIATTTLSTSASSVTFSSISGSYTDLVLISTATVSSGAADLYLRFNGDTAGNYSATILTGDGSTASSTRFTNDAAGLILDYYGSVGTTGHICIAHIMNYSNATTYKTVLSRANRASSGTDAVVGLWRSTAAITSVTIRTSGGNLATGSTFTLYGIKAA